jgi:hypothetical protein
MRCASPPESVDDRRSSVRYSRPTSFRNLSRCWISTRILPAIPFLRASVPDAKRTASASAIFMRAASAMVLPPTGHRALLCAAATRRNRDSARSRDTGSGTRARAACISSFEKLKNCRTPSSSSRLRAPALLVFGEIAERDVEAHAARRPACGNRPAILCPWAWSTARWRLRSSDRPRLGTIRSSE